MKRTVVIAVLSWYFHGSALDAQRGDSALLRMPNQTAYVELGGNAGYASINYDRKLNERFTARIGYGRWAVWRSIPAGDQDSDYARLVPLTLNFLSKTRPTSPHWLEVGIGMVFGDRWSGVTQNPHRPIRAATATIAYRVMTQRNIMRLGIAFMHPVLPDFPVSGKRPGLSFGFVF